MTDAPAKRPGFPVFLTLFTALALALLVGLGVWQMKRLHWKEDLLARIAALQSAPPRPLDDPLRRLAHGDDIDFTRVAADCPNLERTVFLKLYAVHDGEAGFRIITACALTGQPYASLLIDRGFIRQDAVAGLAASTAAPLDRPIVGVLRRGDKKTFVTPDNDPAGRLFYYRDPAAMAKVLGVSGAAPIFLMLETPAPAPGGPIPAPVPADIPNRHFEYAVTWFGLAAALLVVYLASLWRRRSS
ncbi:MAG TPA: SURF1 family protein [Caulobacteraceae bacterium]|jgi:surfeit locus 1 family protein